MEVPLICGEAEGRDTTSFPVDFEELAASIAVPSSNSAESPSELLGQEVRDDLQSRASHVMQKIEQEKLQPVDSLARVRVPVMDFSIPRPAWEDARHSAVAMLTWIKQSFSPAFELAEWPRDKRAELKMSWTPFWSTPRVSTTEEIEHDEDKLRGLLDPPSESEVHNGAEFFSKSSRLAILREMDDEEDDDVEPVFSKHTSAALPDLMEAVKKKAMMRLKGSTKTATSASSGDPSHAQTGGGLLSGDNVGVSERVERYIRLQAPQQVLSRSPLLAGKAKAAATGPTEANNTLAPLEVEKLAPPPTPARFPTFDPLAAPPKAIVALGLPRSFTRCLQSLLPKFDFVERDCGAHNSPV